MAEPYSHATDADEENLIEEVHHWIRPQTRSEIRDFFYYPKRHAKLRPTSWIDGLRGLAALEVLLFYIHRQFLGDEINAAYKSTKHSRQWWRLPIIRSFYNSGHAMASVFMTLSGIVLTYRFLELIRGKKYGELYPALGWAMFRRIIRLLLPAIIITFFGALTLALDVRVDENLVQNGFFEQIRHWFMATLTFCNPFRKEEHHWQRAHLYKPSTWPLMLELYGSVACYAVLIIIAPLTDARKRVAIIFALIYESYVRGNWWLINFLVGMIIAERLSYEAEQPAEEDESSFMANLWQWFWLIVLCGSVYVLGVPMKTSDQNWPTPGFQWYFSHTPRQFRKIAQGAQFWWSLSGTMFVVSISRLRDLRQLLETRPMQYLNRIGYMLYLVQADIIDIFGDPVADILLGLLGTPREFQDKIIYQPQGRPALWTFYFGYMLLVVPTIIIFAAAATQWVDEPVNKFAKWSENKIKDTFAAVVAIFRSREYAP